MRKIYSLVLIAAALLIGTNSWAIERPVGDVTAFKTAWNAAQSGDVIKLTDDITANGGLDVTLWLGTVNQSDAAKSITIDLAGHDLASKAAKAFDVTHGELKIITSVIKEGHNKFTHTGNNETFFVTGSTKKDVDPSVDGSNYFTHLVIGENVTVERPQLTTTKTKPEDNTSSAYREYVNDKYRNYKRAVIAIDAIYGKLQSTNYYTNVYAKNDDIYRGIANGVRIDIYGTVNGLRYGIKPNGYLWNVANFIAKRREGAALPAGGASPLYTANAKLDQTYKIQDGDDSYSPFIHIYPTGKVTALAATPEELVNDMYAPKADSETSRTYWGTPTALYGGGYARWIVEGTAQGASGAIIKSGNVVLQDATIEGLGTYVSATHTTSSNTGEGSGLLIVSDNSWAGDVNVIVNGNTNVSADNGFAIEDVVPATDNEVKLDNLTINGGTLVGGDEGAISISEQTKTANETTSETTILVNSATIEGNVNYGSAGELNDIIPANKDDVTIKIDETTGVKTVVVTVVDQPATIMDDFDIDDAETNANIDLSGDDLENKAQRFDSDTKSVLTLGTLTINNLNDDVTLTITAGHTIIANKVILGDKAQLIVEPGATLIVKGTEGIVSTKPDNIVLQASNTAQATFLLNPAVLNNAEPNATVQMYTVCKQTHANPYYYTFQEFALPVKEGVKPDNDYDGSQPLYTGQTQFGSSVRGFNYEQHTWAYLSSWSQVYPFVNYQMTNNTQNGGITYYFEGKILGNKNRYCQFVDAEGFGYFGNSHLAPINIAKLFEDFSDDVEKTVWIYNYDQHRYQYATEENIFGNQPTEIKSMQAFVLYLNEGQTTTAPINYANAVYNPAYSAATANQAPARNRANTLSNGALISVVAANGMVDDVVLMEKDSYSMNFDNGADASKLMNEDGINLYATTAMGNLSSVADNSIENTLMSFKAGEATNYTLQLGKVFGEDYAIRDNVTGTIINLVEGETYTFTQAANTTVSGRFEVIAVAKIATGIENTEAVKSAKGIYSITGQYLGENFEILPAGVYVVNGVKVVK